jgi:hypothetical protein
VPTAAAQVAGQVCVALLLLAFAALSVSRCVALFVNYGGATSTWLHLAQHEAAARDAAHVSRERACGRCTVATSSVADAGQCGCVWARSGTGSRARLCCHLAFRCTSSSPVRGDTARVGCAAVLTPVCAC